MKQANITNRWSISGILRGKFVIADLRDGLEHGDDVGLLGGGRRGGRGRGESSQQDYIVENILPLLCNIAPRAH